MPHSVRFRMADGSQREVSIRYALNAGYTGSDAEEVRHHVQELAALGVPAPRQVPALYPVSVNLVTQTDCVQVQHDRTSGEAEWALLVASDRDDLLLTVACDHTDRALEAHAVAWSKQAAPNVLGDLAWPLSEIADDLGSFTLRAWVTLDGSEHLIQDGGLDLLLPPSYWVERLSAHSLLRPGTVLLSGTIPMLDGTKQFAEAWRVEMTDPQGRTSRIAYRVERLPAAWD